MNKFSLIACIGLIAALNLMSARTERPNILCITVEDISPRLGCFGDRWVIIVPIIIKQIINLPHQLQHGMNWAQRLIGKTGRKEPFFSIFDLEITMKAGCG